MSKTLRNVNPLGAVEFPLIGRVLEAGETFEIDDTTAAALLEQEGNWELVTAKSGKGASNG